MSTTTATAATIRQTVHNSFPFTVDKLPLQGPDGLRTPHYGLFRSDNGACVGGAVKRGYTPHTVDDIAALAEAAAEAFNGAPCQVSTAWRGGHYAIVAPTADYRREAFDAGDSIWPRMIVSGGCGGSAFSVQFGYYRDICRNLSLIRGTGRELSRKIRHTLRLREIMPSLVEQFRDLAGNWDGTIETIAAMQRQQVNLGEFVAQVYPLPESASRRTVESYRRRASQIVNRIYRERQQLGRGFGQVETVSAWEAYNAIQGYVQHDQRRQGRPSAIDRAILALDDTTVAAALELALAS